MPDCWWGERGALYVLLGVGTINQLMLKTFPLDCALYKSECLFNKYRNWENNKYEILP